MIITPVITESTTGWLAGWLIVRLADYSCGCLAAETQERRRQTIDIRHSHLSFLVHAKIQPNHSSYVSVLCFLFLRPSLSIAPPESLATRNERSCFFPLNTPRLLVARNSFEIRNAEQVFFFSSFFSCLSSSHDGQRPNYRVPRHAMPRHATPHHSTSYRVAL